MPEYLPAHTSRKSKISLLTPALPTSSKHIRTPRTPFIHSTRVSPGSKCRRRKTWGVCMVCWCCCLSPGGDNELWLCTVQHHCPLLRAFSSHPRAFVWCVCLGSKVAGLLVHSLSHCSQVAPTSEGCLVAATGCVGTSPPHPCRSYPAALLVTQDHQTRLLLFSWCVSL